MKRLICILMLSTMLFGCAANIPAEATTEPDAPAAETAAVELDAVSAATLARYREGELQEFEGTRLDPAVGPRDNSIKGVQSVDMTAYRLTVDGLADAPMAYTYDDVLAMESEQRLITLYCVEGWDATILWEGVLMRTLLESVSPQSDANTVIFHATDGYTTSLPLSEILENDLMLAYNANGVALPPEMGYPFIFVAEDKWGYKWARWINEIELSNDASYKGYWEGYGYSNGADLDESFFD